MMTMRATRAGRHICWLVVLAAVLAATAAHATTTPFHPRLCSCVSPYDSCAGSTPAPLGDANPQDIHLCLELQQEVLTSNENHCSQDLPQPTGNEVCGWQAEIVAAPGVTINGFTDLLGVRSHAQAQSLSLNYVSPSEIGEVGVVYLGYMTVLAPPPCTGCTIRVDSSLSEAYDAALDLHSFSGELIGLPEPGAAALLLPALALLGVLGRRRLRRAALAGALLLVPFAGSPAHAQPVLEGKLTNGDLGVVAPTKLGVTMTTVGDIDGDGVDDLAVGLPLLAPSGQGGVMIVFAYRDGSVKSTQILNGGNGGLPPLGNGANFGAAVAAMGDVDGNGIPDLAVGASGSEAVWLLALNADGTIKGSVETVLGTGAGEGHGAALVAINDLDGDGVRELAVGAPHAACAGGTPVDCGMVSVLFIASNGTVKSSVVAVADGGVPAPGGGNLAGSSLARLGDLDANGAVDLAVGLPGYLSSRGEVLIVRLKLDGTRLSEQQIVDDPLGFPVTPSPGDLFGSALTLLGDIDNNGVADLAIGVMGRDGSGSTNSAGAVFLTTLAGSPGFTTVGLTDVFDHNDPGLAAAFGSNTFFGGGLGVTDSDGDGAVTIWVGAAKDAAATEFGLFWKIGLSDVDDDGVPDFADNCLTVRNQYQADADGDGVGNLCDNCPSVSNPAQANSDGDSYGDVCQPPEIIVIGNEDSGEPIWNLYVDCNSVPVRDVNIGVLISDQLTGAHVRFGGGCDLPPVLGGASGCLELETPNLLGDTVDPTTSGVFYSPAAGGGIRPDTLYIMLRGQAGEFGTELCNTDQTAYMGTIDLVPGAGGLTEFPDLALTRDGFPELDPTLVNVVVDAFGGATTDYTFVQASLTAAQVQIELNQVDGTTDEYAVCMKADDYMNRIAFAVDPPQDGGNNYAPISWAGCDGTPDENGIYTCDQPGLFPNVDAVGSFVVKPTPAYAALHPPLDSDRLYVVLEGTATVINGFPTALNSDIGLAETDEEFCVGKVQITGNPEVPTIDVAPGLEQLPFTSAPFAPFVTIDGLTSTIPMTVVNFGLDDYDEDGMGDEVDNCTYHPNPLQGNGGDLLKVSPPDDFDDDGDGCECGETQGDGSIVEPSEVDRLQDLLVGAVVDDDAMDRCSVDGDAQCTIRDAILLSRSIQGQATLQPSCISANGE
jgi:hypothetical protein